MIYTKTEHITINHEILLKTQTNYLLIQLALFYFSVCLGKIEQMLTWRYEE